MDIYDGADWTEMTSRTSRRPLKPAARSRIAAEFLCRADSVDDFARKCVELGLKPKLQS
jgi:hypothetical protein